MTVASANGSSLNLRPWTGRPSVGSAWIRLESIAPDAQQPHNPDAPGWVTVGLTDGESLYELRCKGEDLQTFPALQRAALKRLGLWVRHDGEADPDRWRNEVAIAFDAAAGVDSRNRFSRRTFAELAVEHTTLKPPVVEGLFRKRETVNLVSTPKSGKSWGVYGLALSQVTERKWLDTFQTSGGGALIIDNELHPETLVHRIGVTAEAMGLSRSTYGRSLEVLSLRGSLCSFEELCDSDVFRDGRFETIYLDSKYRFARPGASENDNASEAEFYNQLDRLAVRTDAAIVLVHHSSKGGQADKRVTDVGAGAGAQSRAADCHLVLREHEQPGMFVLDAAIRSFPPIQPLVLRWEFPLWRLEGDADPAKLKRPGTRGQRQADADREGKEKILSAVRGGAATARQLRERVGLGKGRLGRLLDLMVAEGSITPRQTNVRGNDCSEYVLSE